MVLSFTSHSSKTTMDDAIGKALPIHPWPPPCTRPPASPPEKWPLVIHGGGSLNSGSSEVDGKSLSGDIGIRLTLKQSRCTYSCPRMLNVMYMEERPKPDVFFFSFQYVPTWEERHCSSRHPVRWKSIGCTTPISVLHLFLIRFPKLSAEVRCPLRWTCSLDRNNRAALEIQMCSWIFISK